MNPNPYKNHLQEILKGSEADDVTINRADTTDVTGKLSDVDDDGATIVVSQEGDAETRVFIAHRDIRGVSSTGWDMEAIAED